MNDHCSASSAVKKLSLVGKRSHSELVLDKHNNVGRRAPSTPMQTATDASGHSRRHARLSADG
jgi:hypothetical protein